MCGILGYVGSSDSVPGDTQFEHALQTIAHRGPDARAHVRVDGCVLGHARLAIIDLTESGAQPMRYTVAGQELVITYNGELYNYLELKTELLALGLQFTSESDTEVILAAYYAWGDRCLTRFNGMFAFAIWDVREQKLFAARDRLGKKPFYYAQIPGGGFVFSSEIKPFSFLGVIPELDRTASINYVAFAEGYMLQAPQTFYSNILQLPPGHSITVRATTCTVQEWWRVPTAQVTTDIEVVAEQIRTTLADATELRMRSDVPVGLTLSGGLDSTSVLASLSANPAVRELHTFTVSFPGRARDETEVVAETVAYIRARATHLKIHPHYFEYPSAVAFTDVVDFCIQHDEPVRGFDVYAQWLLMQYVATHKVKVVLGGQGGDELFFGYPRYYLYAALDALRRGAFIRFLRDVRVYRALSPTQSVSLILRKCFSILFPAQYVFRRMLSLRGLIRTISLRDIWNAYVANKTAQGRTLTQVRAKEIVSHLSSLLKDEDRNSMAHGIETRLPYLDYRLVEFAQRVEPRLCLQHGFTKYVTRSAFTKYIPEAVAWNTRKAGLYEKNMISQVPAFRQQAEAYIQQSRFVTTHFKTDRLECYDLSMIWRLFNLAVLDVHYHGDRHTRTN